MLLILWVLNMMMYYDLSIADMWWWKVWHIFAENTIKVSNYAFIDTNDNQEYDNGEQTIAVSINFNDMVILPNDRNIFKIGPLWDGSYSYSINVPAWLISSFTQPMTFHITNTNVIWLRPIPLKWDGSNSRITQRKTYLTNGFDDVNQDGIQQSNESSIRYTIFSADGKMIRNSDDVYPQKFRLGVLPNGTYYYQMYKNNIIQKTYFALVNGSINYDVDGNHWSPISKTEYYKELSTKKIMDL